MQLSRRELLATVPMIGGASGAFGVGTAAAFTDTETASGTLQAGTWKSAEGIVYVDGTGELATATHDTDSRTYSVTNVGVTGPGTEAFGNGYEIPYIDGNGTLRLVATDGTERTLTTEGTSPRTSKSILATGSWNGSGSAVFYATGSAIYRVAPGDTGPTHIATLGNSAKAVLGVIDIDEDGTEELVYVDGSAIIRYLKPAKTTEHKVGGFGANNQFGVGRPIQTDAGPRIPIVGGSGEVALRHPDGSKTKLTNGSTATKTALATREVDGSGTPDVAFVNTNGNVDYVTDLTGTSTPEPFTDGDGDQITGVDGGVGVL